MKVNRGLSPFCVESLPGKRVTDATEPKISCTRLLHPYAL
jgi:hypothetical protein